MNTARFALVLLLFFFCSSSSFSQTDTAMLMKHIQQSADSVQLTFKFKNWTKFADLMHPKIMELTGGREAFISLVKRQMESLKDATIDTMKTGNVLQLLYHKGEWQCIVEAFLQMTVEQTTITAVSTSIGVSEDGGLSWKYMRVSDGNEARMKSFIPSLSPSLKIPLNQTWRGTLDEFLKVYKVKYPASGETMKATN